MSKLCCLTEQEYNRRQGEFSGVADISTPEDIATLIDTIEETSKQVPICNISDIMQTKDNHYVCIVSQELLYFDFFKYLNEKANSDVVIGCANVRFLYPRSLSRGLYRGLQVVENNTDDLEDESDEDDIPTGYLDVEETQEPMPLSHKDHERYLEVPMTGAKLPVDENGIIIGRSSSKTDYAVSNSKISRVHAKIYKSGNRYMVHDYDSANGTFIDGLRVRESADREIIPGSKLTLANTDFKFI